MIVRFIILFFSLPVFAGHELGNGGDAIYCEQGRRVELYDYYEWGVQGFNFDVGDDLTSVDERVQILIERLAKIDSVKGKKLHSYFSTFYEDALFRDDFILTDSDDLNPDFIPVGCEIRQAAINRVPRPTPESPIYKFDLNLFRKMSDLDKAGLIFHELLYRLFVEENRRDSYKSSGVRYINAMLAARRFEGLDLKDVIARFESAKFSQFTYEGFQVDITAPYSFYFESTLKSASLSEDTTLKVLGQSVKVLAGPVEFSMWGRGLSRFKTDTGIRYHRANNEYRFSGELSFSKYASGILDSVAFNKGRHLLKNKYFEMNLSLLKDGQSAASFDLVTIASGEQLYLLKEISFKSFSHDQVFYRAQMNIGDGIVYLNSDEVQLSSIKFSSLGSESGEIHFAGYLKVKVRGVELTAQDSLKFQQHFSINEHIPVVKELRVAEDAFVIARNGKYLRAAKGQVIEFDLEGYALNVRSF